MNNQRRKDIMKAAAEMEVAQEALNNAQEILELAHGEEEEYCENMPENMQDGEKYQAAQEAADQLQGAIDAIEDIDLSEIEGCIDTATE